MPPLRRRASAHVAGAALAVTVLAAWLGAAPAAAEVLRCLDAEGRLRFVDSPHACPGARPHAVRGRLERIGTPTPPAAPAAPALEGLLLAEAEVSPAWEVVEEAPAHPERDPDLVAWGVTAQRTRHYTRDVAGEAQVCSVELWRFASAAQARAAHAHFAYPDWTIVYAGDVLVMARGLRLARGARPQRGVFPDCGGLAERIRRRAADAADTAAPAAAESDR